MKALVLTDDRLGPTMAGSALRAWEVARGLANGGHLVCVTGGEGSTRPDGDGPDVVDRPPWGWADVVVGPAWCLPPRAFLGQHRLVVDGATPLLAELETMDPSGDVLRRQRTAGARLPLVAARADAVLVAGAAQRQWWKDRLTERPGVPLIELPFGIPDHDPPAERDEVEGVPPDWAIVLWWGGVWPWLDLDTLLRARAALGDVPLSVLVPTALRPGAAGSRFTKADLRKAMRQHGLAAPQVMALDRWIPYEERHRILHRTSLICVLHQPGAEAELSFRTRAMDGVWAGVPLLLTEGGEVARLTQEHRWGAVVPPGDPAKLAAVLETALSEGEQIRFRSNIAVSRDRWRWTALAEPLARRLRELPVSPRSNLAAAGLRALLSLLPARSRP